MYAISKNEEQFVDRWYSSIKDADEIFVLDTGSTDKTVEKLRSHNINVVEKVISPWRFDVARNLSLDLVPKDTDICICLDLDEVMLPGWREKLESIWQENTTRLRYTYNWYIDENNVPKISYYAEKIHSRKNFKWMNPVHEILKYDGEESQIYTDDLVVNHYPDRSKSRSSYLPLLELAVKEDPTNDRNVHYLGREYMYYGKYNECIDTLIKHINLPTATWKDERCASMRFIARSYKALNRFDEARMWLNKAIDEAPYLRDPYVEMALLEYELKNWTEVEKYCLMALEIKEHAKTYINEVFSWNETVYDLLSLACFYNNKFDEALKYINMALEMNPTDERLLNNLKLIENKIKGQ